MFTAYKSALILLLSALSLNSFGIVTSYPYVESFETGLGDWANDEGDDFDWTRTSSPTPSAGTGPNMSAHGSFYLFTEASTPNHPTRTANLSAAFNFTSLTSPELTFRYHMFGASMGSLHIDVHNGTSWTLDVWTVNGQQHASATTPYSTQVLNLAAYAGLPNVTIRVRGITGPGTGGWRSDMGVDYFEVIDNCSVNPGTASISDDVICTASTVDLSLSGHDGGTTIQWQQSTDDFNYSDISGATSANYTTAPLALGNIYYFRATVTNGCTSYSNTVQVNAGGIGSNPIPYSESFESGDGGWSDIDSEGNNSWTRISGGTPSGQTGPNGASDGTFYMYVEGSNPNFNSTAVMGHYFDFSTATNIDFTFDYHMYGANMGSLALIVNGNTEWSVNGQQNTGHTDPYNTQTVDLSAYAGDCQVVIKFRAQTGNNYRSDIAVDNISVTDPCVLNAGTASINTGFLCGPGTVDLSLTGQDPGSIQWEQSTDQAFWQPISGATTANYTTSTLPGGDIYYFRARVTSGCNAVSNTVSVNVSDGLNSTLPYAEDFEQSFGEWANITGEDDNDWLRITGPTTSVQTGPNGASSGVYYIYVEATNPFINSTAVFENAFDFTINNDIDFEFDYHMYGADMGTLRLIVNNDTVWSITGQQHTSEGDPWTNANIDLSAYAGQCNVVVRLVGETGPDYRSDICVDNIRVTNPCGVNPGSASADISSICNPSEVDLTLTGQDPGAIQWQQSTNGIQYTNIAGATTANYTTDPLTPGSTYYFRAYVLDVCPSYSDSAVVNVQPNLGTLFSPYEESFESGLGDWTNSTFENNDWVRISGPTTSNPSTGPSGAHDGSFYLYVEGSSPYYNSEAVLQSSIDLTGVTDLQFGFYYHMFGSDMGSLSVEINETEVWSISGQQQTASTDPWVLQTIDLNAYLGECNLVVSIIARTGSDFRSDIAIDSVHIFSDEFAWTGNTNTDWNNTGNWAGGFPDGTKDIVIPDVSSASGNFPVLNSGADGTSLALTVNNGASLTLGGSRTLTVTGPVTINGTVNFVSNTSVLELTEDFTNNSTFDQTMGTVRFNGSGTQNITGSTSTFYNIDVTNTSAGGVVIQTPVSLRNTLSLADNTRFENASTFTLLSTSSNTGRIAAVPATAQFVGSLTMQRYFQNSQRQWRYLASPFTNTPVSGWQDDFYITGPFTGADTEASTGDGSLKNNYSMYDYDETDPGSDLLNGYNGYPVSANTELIVNGRGYATFVRNVQPMTIDLTGTPRIANTGAFNFNVDYTNNGMPAIDGWNLIGNPFPSEIDWASGTGWTKTDIDDAIYFTDNENAQNVSYVSGISNPPGACNGVLPSGQGFWVHTNGNGADLRATEDVKTSTEPSYTFYKTAGAQTVTENLLHIKLNQPDADYEYATMHFNPDATFGKDPLYDAIANAVTNNVPFGLWTKDGANGEYLINGLPVLDSMLNKEVPLKFNSDDQGTHEFEFENLSSFSGAYQIFLVDNFVNDSIDILSNPTYLFDVNTNPASQGEGRFKFVFRMGIISGAESTNDPSAWIRPNPVTDHNFNILLSGLTSGATLKLIDLSGKEVFNAEVQNGDNNIRLGSYVQSGMYVYIVSTNDQVKTGRIVIK